VKPTISGNFMLSNRTLEQFSTFKSLCVELLRAFAANFNSIVHPLGEDDTLSPRFAVEPTSLNPSFVTAASDTSLTRIN